MESASSSQKSNGDPTLTTRLDRCLAALRSFRVDTKTKSTPAEQAEILLLVEAARLFTWGIALGIITIPEEHGKVLEQPSVVPELTSYYRQQSIDGTLQTLHKLLTDSDLIKKAYGCLPVVPTKTSSVNAVSPSGARTAAVRFSSPFGEFRTSTMPYFRINAHQWIINNDKKFRLLVAEIRTLVSQVLGMTENLLPLSVRNAMIYTRVWEIRVSWVATAIADACEDIYDDLSLHARELAEVLDMEDLDVERNVRKFIDCWDGDSRPHGLNHHLEYQCDLKWSYGQAKAAEARLLALESCVFGGVSHAMVHPEPNLHGRGRGPAEIGPRPESNMPPLQGFSLPNMGNHRSPPRHEPKHVHAAGKVYLKGEPVRSGAAPTARPPSPLAWPPIDEPVIAKGPKTTLVSQPPLQEQIYTPSTSSAGHSGRDTQRAEIWDDLNSDSDVSDDDMADRLARTEFPPRHKAENGGAAPREVPLRGPAIVKQGEALEDWERNCAAANSRSAPQSGPVGGVRKQDWLGAEVKKSPKQKPKTKSSGITNDIWDFQVPAEKSSLDEDHRHCGNCGEAMDESVHRL